MNDKWLIWSNEHGAWWAPNHNGYASRRSEAGRYDRAEAELIVRGANQHLGDEQPKECMCQDW